MVKNNYTLVENNTQYWEFIRELRNDPEIQKGFVEVVNITKEQQSQYMKKFGDYYRVCLCNDKPIGYIGEIEDDIRVAVISEYQRKGVGKFMVNEFMKLKPNSYAKMKHENIASKKLFESCGFVYQKMDDKFFYYKKL